MFRLRREHQHPQDPDAEAHLLPMLQTRTPSARMDPPAGSFLPGDSFFYNLPEYQRKDERKSSARSGLQTHDLAITRHVLHYPAVVVARIESLFIIIKVFT